LNIIPFAVYTIESGFDDAEPNASVILPHNKVKQGRAAPSIIAASVPRTIRSLSNPSANLKREKNPTADAYFLRVGSSSYLLSYYDLLIT
jgi:hypothetical protein